MPSSYNLPELVKKEIDALVKAGYYSSKSDVVKDALRNFLETKTNLRLAAAVELLKDNKVSLGKAAEIVGMNVIEFKEVLKSRGITRKLKVHKKDMRKADGLLNKLR